MKRKVSTYASRIAAMSGHNIEAHENEKGGFVKYYNTVIVSWDNKPIRIHSRDVKQIRLDTGGWESQATKVRMNRASEIFGLGFKVRQTKGDDMFFVVYGGIEHCIEHNKLSLERIGRTHGK